MLMLRAHQHDHKLIRDLPSLASYNSPYDQFRKSHNRDLSGSTLVESTQGEDDSNMLIPDLAQIKLAQHHLYESFLADRKRKCCGQRQQRPTVPISSVSLRTNTARHDLKTKKKRRGVVDPFGLRSPLHCRRSKGHSLTIRHYEPWINALLAGSIRNKYNQSNAHATQSAVKRERDLFALQCELSFDNPDFDHEVLSFSSDSTASTMACESPEKMNVDNNNSSLSVPRVHRPSRSFGWLNTLRTVKSPQHIRSKSSVASDLNKPLPIPPESPSYVVSESQHLEPPPKNSKRSFSPRKKPNNQDSFDPSSLLPKRQLLDLRYHGRVLHKPSRSLIVKSSEAHSALHRPRRLSKSVDIPSSETSGMKHNILPQARLEEIHLSKPIPHEPSENHIYSPPLSSSSRPISNVGSTRNYSRLFRQSEALTSHPIPENDSNSEESSENSTDSSRNSSYTPLFPMIPPRISSRSAVNRSSRSYRVSDVKKRHMAVERERKSKSVWKDRSSNLNPQTQQRHGSKNSDPSQSPTDGTFEESMSPHFEEEENGRSGEHEGQMTRGSTIVDLDNISLSQHGDSEKQQQQELPEDFSSATANEAIGTIILCLSSPHFQTQPQQLDELINQVRSIRADRSESRRITGPHTDDPPNVPLQRSVSLKRASTPANPSTRGHVRSSKSMPSMTKIVNDATPIPDLPNISAQSFRRESQGQTQDRKDSAASTSSLSDFPAPPPLKVSKSLERGTVGQIAVPCTSVKKINDEAARSGITPEDTKEWNESSASVSTIQPQVDPAKVADKSVEEDENWQITVLNRKPRDRSSLSSGSITPTPSLLRNSTLTPISSLRRPSIPHRRSSKAFVSDSDLYGNMRLSRYLGYLYGNGNVNGSRTLSADLLEQFGGLAGSVGSGGSNGMGLRCDPLIRDRNGSMATLVRVDSPTLPPW